MDRGKAQTGASESALGSLVRKVPAAGVGVLAAVVTVLAMDYWRADTSKASAASKEIVSDGRASPGGRSVIRNVVVDGTAFDRIAELERQLREMNEAKAGEPAGSPSPDEEQLDPEEARRQIGEIFTELDREHRQDPEDVAWAPGATKHLVGGLTTLGEKIGFRVGAVDCKTTTCRAAVTWDNYAAARSTGARLVEEGYGGLNCEQRIHLGEPADPNASYSTYLYLDCTDLRAGVAEEITVAGTL